ncbi:MAG: hypothetical protein NT027_13215 [Proteobacteria bacterium]|nr:hypothetical protein [Pseudomonadota bacterium]
MLLSLSSQTSLCDSNDNSKEEPSTESKEETAEIEANSQTKRRSSYVLIAGRYSSLDFILSGKKGASLSILESENTTYEFEYLKAELKVPFIVEDLGSFSETRLTLQRKSFLDTNSFSLGYGLAYNMAKIEIGSEDMNRWTGGKIPHAKFLEIHSLGFTLSLGNQWSFQNGITIAADWVGWAQPVAITKRDNSILDSVTDESAKSNANKALDVFGYFPRIFALKFGLGWMF